MRVRDAVEADAGALASMTGRPEDVVVDMIHDRSVRVAVEGVRSTETESTETESTEETAGDRAVSVEDPSVEEDAPAGDRSVEGDGSSGTVVGFVAFDVRDGTVHVTTFGGDGNAVRRLLDEPVRFARREEMPVEAVVPVDEAASETIEAAGFDSVGAGPHIDGAPTRRYRHDPSEDN